MPVGTVMVVRLRQMPDEAFLVKLRADFVRAFALDREEDFYAQGPLTVIENRNEGPIPVDDRQSVWLDVGLCRSYYGRGYERGDLRLFVRFAEWLEQHIPGCEVWYGHDIDDENISPFGPKPREELMRYYDEVGGTKRYDERQRRRR